MIQLADVILELRRELEIARVAAVEEELHFELGPIELEVSVAVERQGGPSAKVRFYVVEFGADALAKHASTQRIKLTLQPRLAGLEDRPFVSGVERDRER